ncbi:MAG: sterol desaturase family protein [Chitinophagaceae bacterium]|nr:sterol desaturase family protein [Rubrivivax sp.]
MTVASAATAALPWFDPAAWRVFAGSYGGHLVVESSRYLVTAAVVWLLLHVLLRRRLAHRVIKDWPKAHDVRREIGYSLSTLLVFAALGAGVIGMLMSGRMVIYRDPAQYGSLWLWASLPLMIVWHDFYFYWTHRLLHTPWWFRRVHGVHHRSRSPSPWAAYSFHPVEAAVNGLVTPLALAVAPLHYSVLLLFAAHQIMRNTHGHAAVEVLPRGFARHWLGRHLTTTTHHHLHHETAQGNYGLWFTWWDRWRGTERADYLARFDAVTQAAPASQGAGCAKAASNA